MDFTNHFGIFWWYFDMIFFRCFWIFDHGYSFWGMFDRWGGRLNDGPRGQMTFGSELIIPTIPQNVRGNMENE